MANDVDRLRDELSILEYRAGNLDALAGLISRWQQRIYAYVLAVVGDRDQAWDVSQEVWTTVIRGLRRETDVRHFARWLYTVAHNECVSHFRRMNRLKAHEDDMPEDADYLDPAGLPDDRVLAAADANLVRECLLQLSLSQREAISLFYQDGLSLDDIARILGIPPGTVQSRLHYGRRKLGELLTRKGYRND